MGTPQRREIRLAGDPALDYRVEITTKVNDLVEFHEYYATKEEAFARAREVKARGLALPGGLTFTAKGIACIAVGGREGITVMPSTAVGSLRGLIQPG